MQHRVSRSLVLYSLALPRSSRDGRAVAGIWTVLVAIACGWFVIARVSAQTTDANNILLDFSAKWCGPCQQMSPIVSKLERQGFPIRQVDIDHEKALASQYNVESIPCFVLIANGREVNRITGATDEKQLRSLMMMLPNQNIDEAPVGKSSRNNGLASPASKSGAKAADEKKPFLRIPPLFVRNQGSKLTPTDAPETVRSQNPERQTKTDELISDALAASVRIRVKDGSHVHFGSGTIIDSRPGRAVILTCGHILRELGKGAVIEVDLFAGGNSKPQTTVAQILQYDLDADVGLLTIPCLQRLPIVRLATAHGPTVEDRAFSIGCGGGDRPTVEDHVVTAINGCVGPDNLECTGVPQQGRSGGGLFLGSEQIGVCILADPKFKRGIYTGMKPVAQLLAKAKLGHLAPASHNMDATVAEVGSSLGTAALGGTVGSKGNSSSGDTDAVARLLEASLRDPGGTTSSPSSTSRAYEGAEIVCIVRPKTPGAISRVVIVNQASSRFIDDLLHESSGGSRSDTAPTVQRMPTKASSENQPAAHPASPAARMALRTPSLPGTSANDYDRPIETSFEPQRYRRKRD